MALVVLPSLVPLISFPWVVNSAVIVFLVVVATFVICLLADLTLCTAEVAVVAATMVRDLLCGLTLYMAITIVIVVRVLVVIRIVGLI